MKKASEKVMSALQERGYRITDARLEVVNILAGSSRPLTIQAIVKKAQADEASVYRTIELLRQEKLINEIPVEGTRPCFEIVLHHHHHAVCQGCGRVEHVPCGKEPITPKKIPGFSKIKSHELTFYGLCTDCV